MSGASCHSCLDDPLLRPECGGPPLASSGLGHMVLQRQDHADKTMMRNCPNPDRLRRVTDPYMATAPNIPSVTRNVVTTDSPVNASRTKEIVTTCQARVHDEQERSR